MCGVMFFLWVINFYWHASARHFPDEKKWYNLKMLVTWVGPLNLAQVCAIFSASVEPCPARSLQFVQFWDTVWAGEIVPHTTATPAAAASTSSTCGWLTDYWLAEAFWDIMRGGCQSSRHAGTSPRGPCLHTLLSQIATETASTNFFWKVRCFWMFIALQSELEFQLHLGTPMRFAANTFISCTICKLL